MALDTAHITGSITARLTDSELRRVCDHLENSAAGDEDAARATLVAALTDTVTDIVGALPWGGCSATVTEDHHLLTVTFDDDAPDGPLEVCELLASWFSVSITVTDDVGAAHYDVGHGKVTCKTAVAT